MKILLKQTGAYLLLLLLGCAACSSPTDPFAPGGQYYVAPGRFVGLWSLWERPNSGPIIQHDLSCTANVAEADSVLKVRVINDSTGEVFALEGKHVIPGDVQASSSTFVPDPHTYYLTKTDPAFDTSGQSAQFSFTVTGDAFSTSLIPVHPDSGFWATVIGIKCSRK